MFKFLYLSSVLFLLSFSSLEDISSETRKVNTIEKLSEPHKWNILLNTDSIRISSIDKVCMRNGRKQKLMLLKYENKLSTPLSFTFERHTYREDKCSTCSNPNSDEYTFTVSLEANGSLEGTCGNYDQRSLFVFHKFIKTVPGMSNREVSSLTFKEFKFN